jgi:hypothetical protein
MKARGRQLGMAVCAIALVLPAASSAGSGTSHRTVPPRSLALEMQLRASNGYLLRISGYGHRHVEVLASKDHYFAFYETTGSVSRDHIRADLGRFGHVAVHFDGSVKRRPDPADDSCTGPRPIFETGSFRGAIEFDGEQGYTDVSARRASGSAYRTFKRVCPPGHDSGVNSIGVSLPRAGPVGAGPTGSDDFTVTLLTAVSRAKRRAAYLTAVRIDQEPEAQRPSPWLLSAGLVERIGRIATSKTVYVEARPTQIEVSAKGVHPASAEVAPAAPFLGAASFEEGPDPAQEWTGTLSLILPGVGVVPLVGESFDAVLCQTGSIRQLNRCTGAIEAQSRPQISGSQSQLFADARLSWLR